MQAKAYFRSPNYFDKLRAREKTISDGLKELEANLLLITDCELILRSKTEAAIQEIIKYRENVLAELKVSREEAEHALVEARKQVAEHIYQDPYEPATQLAKSLWNFQSGNLKLFSYTLEGKYQVNISKSQPKLQQVLIQPPQNWAYEYEEEEEEEEEIVSEENDENIPSPILYIIKPKTISCYNVFAGLYSRDIGLSRTIKVNQTTAYCLLDTGTLWVCGGSSPYTNFVYEIDPSSGEVSNRSSMLMSRGGHAVLQYKNCIYVFGGYDGQPMSHCERYVFSIRDWEERENMIRPRYYFNPCSYRQFVYLFGGKQTVQAEMYDIGVDCFTALDLSLPQSGATCAVLVEENKIAVIQKTGMLYWNIYWRETEGEEQLIENLENCWGNASPIFYQDCIYVPHSRIQILRV